MKAEPTIRRVDQVFDEVLVLYAQEGRREALDRLASRWRPRHYAHARRLLGPGERAADAVQDAWVSIVRGLYRLRDPSRFPAWSYAIVTRRCQDIVRQRSRSRETVLDEDLEAEAPPALDAVDDLRVGMNTLTHEQRATVALFYREGLTVLEIADAMKIPIGTVKTRLFHARRTLRQFLSGAET
jgi:RNA polymerase sigma factor (sigma-70 family)